MNKSRSKRPTIAIPWEWLESVLGASKEGVFTADFLSKNGTTVSVRDGGTALLDCRVYLRHDKTVGEGNTRFAYNFYQRRGGRLLIYLSRLEVNCLISNE